MVSSKLTTILLIMMKSNLSIKQKQSYPQSTTKQGLRRHTGVVSRLHLDTSQTLSPTSVSRVGLGSSQ